MSMQEFPQETRVSEAERVVCRHFALVAGNDVGAVEENVTVDFLNLRAADEPPAARQRGPEGLRATMGWLARAFADLHFEIHEIITDGDRVAARVTMHGRQHGPFVVHDSPDGRVTEVFPPTGRSLAVRQTHWFQIEGGRIAEHDAVRDDLGMAKQLGWIPPRPAYLAGMLIARRRERRATRA